MGVPKIREHMAEHAAASSDYHAKRVELVTKVRGSCGPLWQVLQNDTCRMQLRLKRVQLPAQHSFRHLLQQTPDKLSKPA